jgi:ribulose-5-phosphate 4-epimerase/fuculose-1-phosphate aldolase
MGVSEGQIREEIVEAARAFYALGYLHAFGHISARWGTHLLITPTRPPFPAQRVEDVLEVDFKGEVTSGDAAGRPIEVFLHVAIYRARADVNAVCRTHAPAASRWPGAVPPILHGFGGIAEPLALYSDVDLVHNLELGARAAEALGAAQCLLLRGNGALSVGASIGQAAARMWSLEERCAAAEQRTSGARPFTAMDHAARKQWYDVEEHRIWNWLKHLGGRIDSDGHCSRSRGSCD